MSYPAGSSFTVEAQTKDSCNAANYTSEWFAISGLTGSQQVITLDLNIFGASNTDAVVGFVFAGFDSSATWSLSDLKFTCGSLDGPSTGKPSAELPMRGPTN